MSLVLKSREQIAGDIVRAIVSQTDITDVATGSSLAILIESIASVQFQIQMKIMKILESSNIESLVGVALDNKAKSLGLPNGIGGFGRINATKARGNVTVGSAFTKISSKSYAGKPSPYAGSKILFLENASSFPATGSLYLGRGTADRFEGPIPYTAVVNNASYWTITLSKPMTKSHAYSDLITLAQGGDRIVNIGTGVNTVAAEGKPSASYTSMSSAVLADGESDISIPVICSQFGDVGNALAGSITQFASPPFSGAKVTNPTAFINGRSTENDEDLRKRIKNFPDFLARGTAKAIVASIQGAKDKDTGKTILSAAPVEVVAVGDSAIIYIDDGTGLEPSFSPQPYELLLDAALGIENNLKLSQVPVTACVGIGTTTGPFILTDGTQPTVAIDYIEVLVDGVRERYSITPSNYASLQAATCYEIVRDFNASTSNSLTAWRTIDGGTRVVCFDQNGNAGLMQILSSPLQIKLGLPTTDIKPLYLYEDGRLLNGSGLTARITTADHDSWTALTSPFTASLLTGQITQTATIQDSDFAAYSTTVALAPLSAWVSVLKTKFAGVSFEISGNKLVFVSQLANSSESILRVVAGSTAWSGAGGIMDPTAIAQLNVGVSKDYDFNRMTGDIQFLTSPSAGARVEAGTRNTRAAVSSVETSTGDYNFANLIPGVGLSKMVVAFDDSSAVSMVTPSTPSFNAVTITNKSTNLVTMTFDSAYYALLVAVGMKVGDFFLLTMDTNAGASWGDVEGIYRIKSLSTYAISFEVSPTQYSAFSAIFGIAQFLNTNMFKMFRGEESVPQLVSFPVNFTGAISIDDLAKKINSQIFGGTAEKASSTHLILRSNRFSAANGARVCSVLAVSGSIGSVFVPTVASGIQAHVAASESKSVGGSTPIVAGIATSDTYSSGRSSRSYMRVDRVMTEVTDLGVSPITVSNLQGGKYPKGCEHLWTSGQNAQFEGRVYNVGTSGGFDGVMSGKGMQPQFETASNLENYRNFGVRVQDLGVSWDDKLVVVLDQNQSDKTISVPMGKKALIQDMDAIPADGQPQSVNFRLKDPDASNLAFFDNNSIFKGFDFSDFNMLTKSTGVARNFSSIASEPRTTVTMLPFAPSSAMGFNDYLSINDGLGSTMMFRSLSGNIAYPIITFTQGSSTLYADSNASITVGSIIRFFDSGSGLPDPIAANPILYVKTQDVGGGHNFSVSYTVGGPAITISSLPAGTATAIARGYVAIKLPPVTQAIGSLQSLPIADPSLLSVSVTNDGTLFTSTHNHGLAVGDGVIFSATGLVSGITKDTQLYWVSLATAHTFKVATSYANALVPTHITGITGGTSWTAKRTGIWDGETFTISDGTNSSSIFEFDSDGSTSAGRLPIIFDRGTAATGSITFVMGSAFNQLSPVSLSPGIPTVMGNGYVSLPSGLTGLYTTGQYVVLGSWADHANVASHYGSFISGHSLYYVSEFTSSSSFRIRASALSGEFTGPATPYGPTSGNYTAYYVNPAKSNPQHDDRFTISNGVDTAVFRIWMSVAPTSFITNGDIPVVAPLGLSEDSTGWVGNSDASLASAFAAAVNGLPWFSLTASPSSGTCSLTCQRNNALSSAISVALSNGRVTPSMYTLVGMSGGSNPSTADQVAANVRTAINNITSSLLVTASALNIDPNKSRDIDLTNDDYGILGNQTITGSNPSGQSFVPKSGMAGGLPSPTAADMRDLYVSAINEFASLGTFQLQAAASSTADLVLLGDLTGSYSVVVTPVINSGATLTIVSTAGSDNSALSDNALVIRSIKFGCPNRLALSINYATLPNQSSVVVSHTNTFDSSSYSPGQTCSFVGSPTITCANHGLAIGDKVIFVSSNTLPLGLNENQIYFVRTVPLTSTFTVSASSVDPALSSNVSYSGSGSGSLSFRKINDEFSAKTVLNVSLKSGAAVGGALLNTGTYTVSTRMPDQYTRRLTITSSGINQGPILSYSVGDVLTIGGGIDVTGSYLITFSGTGVVEVAAPGSSRVISGTYQAALAPINTFPVAATTIQDIATAINAYNPNNPIATAQALGAGASSEVVTNATYLTNVQDYQGFDAQMSEAVSNHALNCKLSGIANVYKYDSSDPALNNVVALVQTNDSLFPNAQDTAGLSSYSFVDEEVYLVPSNKVTASRWLNFVVSSSLPLLSNIDNVGLSGADVQISSHSDGSLGAVKVSTSGANQADSFIIENATEIGDSTRAYVLSATADKFVRDNMVAVQNSLSSEITRSCANTASATAIDSQPITEYFRPTTAIRYEKAGGDIARLYFNRADMAGATLSNGTVSITKVDVGLYNVKVASGTGTLAARTGDICLFGPASSFPAAWKYASAQTVDQLYPGHQVVAVISNVEILISAINDDAVSGSYTISSSYDLVFAPAIWNEKNIRTNKLGGTEFADNNAWGGGCWISYKKIGDNFLSIWLKNSATEATDDMQLKSALVSTDDFVYLPNGNFNGVDMTASYRLVAHNGRNNLIVYNPNGVDALMESGNGSDYWLKQYTGTDRAIRILDSNTVKAGDKLRISSSVSSGATWFDASMLGSWTVRTTGWSQKAQGTASITVSGVPTNANTFTLTDGYGGDIPVIFEFNTSSSAVVSGHVWVDTSSGNTTTIAGKVATAINALSARTFLRATSSIMTVTIMNTLLGTHGALTGTVVGTYPTYVDNLDTSASNDPHMMIPYVDVDMPSCPRFVYDSLGVPVDSFTLAGNSGAIGFIEGTPMSVVRVVGGTAIDPINFERSELFLAPRRQTSKMSSSYGTQLVAMNKFGFSNNVNFGVDGYVSFSGLIKEAHKIIDGSPIDPVTYPGVRAAGTKIEVLPPLVKSITISLTVVTKEGVSLGSLTETIKSSVASYVNALGVGQPVIISSIIRVVQSIPGVSSVLVTSTLPAVDTNDQGKITVSDYERAYIINANSDVTVG